MTKIVLQSLFCSLLCLYQVADWAIDYGISGGTDREGWQYAADFPTWVYLTFPNTYSLVYLSHNLAEYFPYMKAAMICVCFCHYHVFYLPPSVCTLPGRIMATRPWRTLFVVDDGPGTVCYYTTMALFPHHCLFSQHTIIIIYLFSIAPFITKRISKTL